MVDRQLFRARLAAAVLTGRVIALEQVPTAEGDGLVPCPIVTRERQHLRHTQMKSHRPDERFSLPGASFAQSDQV